MPLTPAPRAAFLVAAWNAERTLRASLLSALEQSEPSLEVVVVDDGSSDETRAIAGSLARSDPRLRVVRQPRRGPAAARNRGVRETTAPYVCFLDADDAVPPQKLAVQAALLDAHSETAVVYGGHDEVFDGGAPRPAAPVPEPGDMVRGLLSGGYAAFALCSGLIRRSSFVEVGGFRLGDPLVEDVDLWMRMSFHGCRFEREDRTRSVIRHVPGSRSSERLTFQLGLIPMAEWLWARRGELPDGARRGLRRSFRYRLLVVRRLAVDAGRRDLARAAVLRSLGLARRPGELMESGRLAVRTIFDRAGPAPARREEDAPSRLPFPTRLGRRLAMGGGEMDQVPGAKR